MGATIQVIQCWCWYVGELQGVIVVPLDSILSHRCISTIGTCSILYKDNMFTLCATFKTQFQVINMVKCNTPVAAFGSWSHIVGYARWSLDGPPSWGHGTPLYTETSIHQPLAPLRDPHYKSVLTTNLDFWPDLDLVAICFCCAWCRLKLKNKGCNNLKLLVWVLLQTLE